MLREVSRNWRYRQPKVQPGFYFRERVSEQM